MAQFTIYSSSDSGAPTLNGSAGSLLSVLDACLVNGYGSQPAAGWLKAFPTTSSYAAYQQGSGVGFYLFVGDNAVGGQAGAEAFLTGFDSITSINNGLVTGSNPFPTFTQLGLGSGSVGGYGAVVARKSSVATPAARNWTIYADSRTIYGFIKTLDVGQSYYAFAFGDFYSFKSGSADIGRCLLIGRAVSSSSLATNERLDALTTFIIGGTGSFASHTFSGGGGSIAIGRHGDGIKASATQLNGIVPYLNGTDNGVYISPVWIVESVGSSAIQTVRGQMRGFYQFCHATSSLIDTQQFTGSAAFSAYTFQVVQPSGNAGTYFLETSNTLLTN